MDLEFSERISDADDLDLVFVATPMRRSMRGVRIHRSKDKQGRDVMNLTRSDRLRTQPPASSNIEFILR